MKKCFIGMSINKQLYFGIFGISFLFGILCLFLIFLSSYKLFSIYNTRIKALFNELDTNIISLNAENADLFGQILFHQGKFESFLIRNYYSNLLYNFGEELVKNINIEETELNKHFKLYTDTSNLCVEENSKCFFIYNNINTIDNFTKKKLYFLIPILDMSLDIRGYNKDNLVIFKKFVFYENNVYYLYKYNKTNFELNFSQKLSPEKLINNTLTLFINEISLIEELNEIKVNQITNYDFFKKNAFVVSPSFEKKLLIDPLNSRLEQFFQFGSFFFSENNVKDNENFDINKINKDNLLNYLSFCLRINDLAYYILNFIQRNGGIFVIIINNDLNSVASKSICNVVNYTNLTYSDYNINNNLTFTLDYLGIDVSQITEINSCFNNKDAQNIINYGKDYNYKTKILANIYHYSYNKDINDDIKVKIIRVLSPNKVIKSFTNLKFLSSNSAYFIVIKIYNNIMIISTLIDRITYKGIIYLILLTFILWAIIYICIFIKLYLVADRISSPIRKLIKNISLSQGSFNNNGTNFEKIYYKEDKDINDLFQLCQRLIIGGFRKKNYIKKQNKINVYNNISKVKTNNMIINENDIITQRNQKYKEIFERGNESKKKKDKFKDEIYHQYKNNDLELKIKNYEKIKNKNFTSDKKEEIENLKTKDNEYKMFYYINKEIEGYLPYNNLYKCYYEEFSKKVNKKKKK